MNSARLTAVTIFLSAFLLFLIQPLVGRILLPWFGGASSVWATSLLFFTTMLFMGYSYAYFLSRLSRAAQARTHLWCLALGALTIIGSVIVFHSPSPPLDWTLQSSLPPSALVLLALFTMIGIPYFLLATTGPLLQYWFSIREKREPYHLYVLSNIGSFLALGSYPFVIEPAFPLRVQSGAWAALFLLFVLCCALVAYRFLRDRTHMAHTEAAQEAIPYSDRLLWIAYALIPSALLVATTTTITQTIAPVPFLWVLPLALYLLSFILAFRGWGGGGINASVIATLAGVIFFMFGYQYDAVTRQILIYLSFFFAAALFCHAQLYKTRPRGEDSALFYLMISLGGAVGTLVVAIIAPLVFNDWLEFPIAVTAAVIFAALLFPAMQYLRDGYERHAIFIRAAFLFVAAASGMYTIRTMDSYYSFLSRNFYGVVKIYESDGEKRLYHGTTLHGKQFMDTARALIPTTYYGPTSGIGRALLYERARNPRGLSAGALGLGTGSLAVYCTSKDHFVFYEIDARIEHVAREQFSYLPHCTDGTVKIGDGRKVLEAELRAANPERFDVLAIDAFSDDIIPAHLLTKESVSLYLEHLKDEKSLLVIHTSNRFLELAPVVLRIAHELNLSSLVVNDSPENASDRGLTSSEWVILARDGTILKDKRFADVTSYTQPSPHLWTDDYMNILGALSLPAIYNWSK